MRGKGEGGFSRVPKDPTKPLKYWRGVIELPSHTGDRRRKYVTAKDKRVALKKFRDAQAEVAKTGDIATRGLTVATWMDEWFNDIAVKTIRPKTAMAYRSLIANHIIPTLGAIRLDKLTARDVRQLEASILGKGKSGNTALQAHRILAVALKHAEWEGHVARNVATKTPAPTRPRLNVRALTLDEGIHVLETAATDPLGSLWAAVLLTGQRQGELLGLERDRVGEVLDITWQLQRLTWQHGCDPHCGRKRGWDCRSRQLIAPLDWEHRHIKGGLWLSRPKSKAGIREIPLVDPLKSIIERHIAETAHEPNPHNLVWHTPSGAPIDPKNESVAWHALLGRAEVPDVPLHAGRHTTADILYEANVAEDIIIEILGHSNRGQSRGYKSRGNRKRLEAAMRALSAQFTQPIGERSDTPALDE
jgi:integrase